MQKIWGTDVFEQNCFVRNTFAACPDLLSWPGNPLGVGDDFVKCHHLLFGSEMWHPLAGFCLCFWEGFPTPLFHRHVLHRVLRVVSAMQLSQHELDLVPCCQNLRGVVPKGGGCPAFLHWSVQSLEYES